MRRITRLLAVFGVVSVMLVGVATPAVGTEDFKGFSRQNLYDDPESDGLRRTAAPDAGVAVPAGTGNGKRIVYSVPGQRVWLVEANNRVVRTYRVSGRAGTPRPGSYAVFSKSEYTTSGSVWMRYMVRFARGQRLAIGFHTIPRTSSGRPIQSTSELGSYRSHGCVRQADSDAIALWNFAPIGTPVIVT